MTASTVEVDDEALTSVLLRRQIAGTLPLISELEERLRQLHQLEKLHKRVEQPKVEKLRIEAELKQRGIE